MIGRIQFKGLSCWRILIVYFIALVTLSIFNGNLTGNSLVLAAENTPPTANITSPSDGSTYIEGIIITFTGLGSDAEDGTLIGSSLVWTSSIDGQIGTGTSFSTASLSVEAHTITLTATDSDGATDTDSVSIGVDAVTATPPSYIKGKVTDADTGVPIQDAQIETNDGGLASCLENGTYLINHSAGTWTITASAAGYESVTHTEVVVPEGGSVTQDFELIDVLPTISSTTPTNNSTDVYVNRAITATFSEAMDSSTITTTTFLVNDGSSNISGIVTYSGTTATFTPSTDLDYNTTYTATITNGAKSLAGNALESDYTWSFTTGTALDIESPIVISTTPADNATDVATNVAITATFSEAMDSSTITTTTFLVNDGSSNISGTVTYSGTTATFTPSTDLDYNTTYTATITNGAKDLAGNALESDYTWSFTTGSEQNDDDNDGQCFIDTAANGSSIIHLSPLPIAGISCMPLKFGFLSIMALIILFVASLKRFVRLRKLKK